MAMITDPTLIDMVFVAMGVVATCITMGFILWGLPQGGPRR